VEVTAEYFLDPPRMPAEGSAFASTPMLTFEGSMGLRGGVEDEIGAAICRITMTQRLRPGGVEVASSQPPEWIVSYVHRDRLLMGENPMTTRQRDFGPIIFNLDRNQVLYITLVTRIHLGADLGGVIGFAPLTVGIPQWPILSLG
jgi:hypothetical protein